MSDGTGSTLIIHPWGISPITMGLTGATTTLVYTVPLQTLDFNEELRWQAIYSENPAGEGGIVIGEYGPLVPVVFQVIIKATSRGTVISAYNVLQQALINPRGGMIQYKPENLGASVLDTYYHYVQSSPPRLLDVAGNRWDAAPKSDGFYTLYVEVEFLTMPLATSDPDNPETIPGLSGTIQNWRDSSPSQVNYVSIAGVNLRGTMPTLVRFLARPGSGQRLGRLIVFRRSDGTLSNFNNVLEAEDATVISPSVAWTQVNESARGNGGYKRCLPPTDANGMAQGLRFTIANPSDHKGRFAVFGVGYDDAGEAGIWTHQVKLVTGNVVQEGGDFYEATDLRTWSLIYAGELELPAAPMSDSEGGYDTGPYLEWYSTRVSGSSEFRLDALLLVYVADALGQPCCLDVVCEDEGGITNSEKLLVENLPDDYGHVRELAHVVDSTDGDLKRVLSIAPRGDFLVLKPGNHRLVFVQERFAGVIFNDDFSDYIGSFWMPVKDFEDPDWDLSVDFSLANYNVAEGSWSGFFTSGDSEVWWYDIGLDLENDGRFTSDDFVCIVVYCPGGQDPDNELRVIFSDESSNAFYYDFVCPSGWNFLYGKKTDFTQVNSPDWGEMTRLNIDWNPDVGASSEDAYADHLRIEKADPDASTVPNATGSAWNFQPDAGAWAITRDVGGAGATLACLDKENEVEKSALIDVTTPSDVSFRARVMAKRDAGYVGIIWRADNTTLTERTEDCYAAVLDVLNDRLLVREYADGSITQHDNPDFTSVVDTWYVVGVVAKGSTFQVYATAASNLDDDDDVFAAGYLLSTVTDATLASGKCGVMSISTLGRFDEVKLVSLQDKVVPADEITLEGKAIWRTIAPFYE